MAAIEVRVLASAVRAPARIRVGEIRGWIDEANEPSDAYLRRTAKSVRAAYQDVLEERARASCARVSLIPPEHTKKSTSLALSGDIGQIVEHYQTQHKAIYGERGDFTETTGFADVLRKRFSGVFDGF